MPFSAYGQQYDQALKEVVREYRLKVHPTKDLTPELQRALNQEAQDALHEAAESPEADIKKTLGEAQTQGPYLYDTKNTREPSAQRETEKVKTKKSNKSAGDAPSEIVVPTLDGNGIPAVLEFGSTPSATPTSKGKNSSH